MIPNQLHKMLSKDVQHTDEGNKTVMVVLTAHSQVPLDTVSSDQMCRGTSIFIF